MTLGLRKHPNCQTVFVILVDLKFLFRHTVDFEMSYLETEVFHWHQFSDKVLVWLVGSLLCLLWEKSGGPFVCFCFVVALEVLEACLEVFLNLKRNNRFITRTI